MVNVKKRKGKKNIESNDDPKTLIRVLFNIPDVSSNF